MRVSALNEVNRVRFSAHRLVHAQLLVLLHTDVFVGSA